MLKHFSVLLAVSMMLLGNVFGDHDKPPPHKLPPLKEEPYRGYTGLSTSIDFLWWKAWEDNLDYADQFDTDNTGSILTLIRNQIREPDTDYDPGFRLSLGYNIPKKYWWDVTFAWVRFHTSGSDAIQAPDPGFLSPFRREMIILWAPLTISGAETASDTWKLRYNTFDLILSRTFFVNHRFSLAPGIGLRGALIHQNFLLVANDIPPTSTFGALNARNDFDGIGLWTGFKADWMIWKGIGIFGEGSLSLLYGRFRTMESLTTGNPSTSVTNRLLRDKFYRYRSNFEAALGLRYKYEWQKVALGLQFGYEILDWINQNMFRVFLAVGPQWSKTELGNLGMHGWRFRAGLDF